MWFPRKDTQGCVLASTHVYTHVHTHVPMHTTQIKFDVISRKIIVFWPSVCEALDSSSIKKRFFTAALVTDNLPEHHFLYLQGERDCCIHSGSQGGCSSEIQAQRDVLHQTSQCNRHCHQWNKNYQRALYVQSTSHLNVVSIPNTVMEYCRIQRISVSWLAKSS